MRALLLATAVGLGWVVPAQAAFILDIEQVGADVVATGTGSIQVNDLKKTTQTTYYSLISPRLASVLVGITERVDQYNGAISGPISFGPGVGAYGKGVGDLVGILPHVGALYLPVNYVSGSALSGNATFSASTFASLGLTPGTYTYLLGSSTNPDTFTVQIGPALTSVPEPATLTLLGTCFLGLAALQRRRGPE